MFLVPHGSSSPPRASKSSPTQPHLSSRSRSHSPRIIARVRRSPPSPREVSDSDSGSGPDIRTPFARSHDHRQQYTPSILSSSFLQDLGTAPPRSQFTPSGSDPTPTPTSASSSSTRVVAIVRKQQQSPKPRPRPRPPLQRPPVMRKCVVRSTSSMVTIKTESGIGNGTGGSGRVPVPVPVGGTSSSMDSESTSLVGPMRRARRRRRRRNKKKTVEVTVPNVSFEVIVPPPTQKKKKKKKKKNVQSGPTVSFIPLRGNRVRHQAQHQQRPQTSATEDRDLSKKASMSEATLQESVQSSATPNPKVVAPAPAGIPGKGISKCQSRNARRRRRRQNAKKVKNGAERSYPNKVWRNPELSKRSTKRPSPIVRGRVVRRAPVNPPPFRRPDPPWLTHRGIPHQPPLPSSDRPSVPRDPNSLQIRPLTEDVNRAKIRTWNGDDGVSVSVNLGVFPGLNLKDDSSTRTAEPLPSSAAVPVPVAVPAPPIHPGALPTAGSQTVLLSRPVPPAEGTHRATVFLPDDLEYSPSKIWKGRIRSPAKKDGISPPSKIWKGRTHSPEAEGSTQKQIPRPGTGRLHLVKKRPVARKKKNKKKKTPMAQKKSGVASNPQKKKRIRPGARTRRRWKRYARGLSTGKTQAYPSSNSRKKGIPVWKRGAVTTNGLSRKQRKRRRKKHPFATKSAKRNHWNVLLQDADLERGVFSLLFPKKSLVQPIKDGFQQGAFKEHGFRTPIRTLLQPPEARSRFELPVLDYQRWLLKQPRPDLLQEGTAEDVSLPSAEAAAAPSMTQPPDVSVTGSDSVPPAVLKRDTRAPASEPRVSFSLTEATELFGFCWLDTREGVYKSLGDFFQKSVSSHDLTVFQTHFPSLCYVGDGYVEFRAREFVGKHAVIFQQLCTAKAPSLVCRIVSNASLARVYDELVRCWSSSRNYSCALATVPCKKVSVGTISDSPSLIHRKGDYVEALFIFLRNHGRDDLTRSLLLCDVFLLFQRAAIAFELRKLTWGMPQRDLLGGMRVTKALRKSNDVFLGNIQDCRQMLYLRKHAEALRRTLHSTDPVVLNRVRQHLVYLKSCVSYYRLLPHERELMSLEQDKRIQACCPDLCGHKRPRDSSGERNELEPPRKRTKFWRTDFIGFALGENREDVPETLSPSFPPMADFFDITAKMEASVPSPPEVIVISDSDDEEDDAEVEDEDEHEEPYGTVARDIPSDLEMDHGDFPAPPSWAESDSDMDVIEWDFG